MQLFNVFLLADRHFDLTVVYFSLRRFFYPIRFYFLRSYSSFKKNIKKQNNAYLNNSAITHRHFWKNNLFCICNRRSLAGRNTFSWFIDFASSLQK